MHYYYGTFGFDDVVTDFRWCRCRWFLWWFYGWILRVVFYRRILRLEIYLTMLRYLMYSL